MYQASVAQMAQSARLVSGRSRVQLAPEALALLFLSPPPGSVRFDGLMQPTGHLGRDTLNEALSSFGAKRRAAEELLELLVSDVHGHSLGRRDVARHRLEPPCVALSLSCPQQP